MCGFCDIENKDEQPINLFTDEEIEMFIIGVYAGVYSVKNLDLNTYLKVARKLSQGVSLGYDKTLFDLPYGSEDWVMLSELKNNVYKFSAAKQYHQIKDMSKALTTGGKVTPYNEFKKIARSIFDEYNENYLRAEYNSAIGQSRAAARWQEYVKEANVLPMLTYQTAGDGRVRPTHEALDGITRPVNDNFWNKFYPPNGWNCRCIVIQNGEDTPKTSLKGFVTPNDVPPEFQFNAGKEKVVFSDKHPYFTVSPRDKQDQKNNWGMPLV